MSWALCFFIAGVWWALATAWRLVTPQPATPFWVTLTRDVLPGALLGLLIARLA